MRLLTAAFVTLFSTSAMAQSLPVPADGIQAALEWYDRQGLSLQTFKAMPIAEAGKRLNQAVYAFCSIGPQPADINELFRHCSTACGGYSYVLRGLLESLGAVTRYANFYNIPNQGNHTAVEIKLADGSWGFLDPTFGDFFTEDGTADGKLMSIHKIAYRVPKGALKDHVIQSRDEWENVAGIPLAQLYSAKFEHQFMSLDNYQLAEHISVEDSDSLLSLDIPLSVSSGSAMIGEEKLGDTPDMEKKWLDSTNATLNDQDLLNDTSFNTSFLYNDAEMSRMTTISLDGLSPGTTYQIRLVLGNNQEPGRIQLSGVGKSLKFPTTMYNVPSNGAILEKSFLPLKSTAEFQLRNTADSGILRLSGVVVTRN